MRSLKTGNTLYARVTRDTCVCVSAAHSTLLSGGWRVTLYVYMLPGYLTRAAQSQCTRYTRVVVYSEDCECVKCDLCTETESGALAAWGCICA